MHNSFTGEEQKKLQATKIVLRENRCEYQLKCKKLKEEDAALCVFSMLDDIACLLNVRKNDIDFNPFRVSCAIAHVEYGVMLYCDD